MFVGVFVQVVGHLRLFQPQVPVRDQFLFVKSTTAAREWRALLQLPDEKPNIYLSPVQRRWDGSMKAELALELLATLADGVDPETAELLPEGHILQRPDVVRALYAGIRALEQPDSSSAPRADQPARVGQAWTQAEDADLTRSFERGETIRALATEHGRTSGAIRSRLVRLGLIERAPASPQAASPP